MNGVRGTARASGNRKKVATTVYLTAKQYAALLALHERTRVPVAEYIRIGVDWIISENASRLPSIMSDLYPGETEAAK